MLDDSTVEGLLYLTVICVGLLCWYLWRAKALRRRRAWRQFARRRGWRLVESPLPPVTDMLENKTARKPALLQECDHPLFKTGYYGRAPNLAVGDHGGRRVMCFDYEYDEQHASTSTVRFLCVLVPSAVDFPRLVVRPEAAGVTRSIGLAGTQDIEFESDDFNQNFLVACQDRRFAFDVLHPRSMELLMSAPDVHLEALGRQLLLYHPQQGSDASGLEGGVERLLALAGRFLDLLPGYLVQRQPGPR